MLCGICTYRVPNRIPGNMYVQHHADRTGSTGNMSSTVVYRSLAKDLNNRVGIGELSVRPQVVKPCTSATPSRILLGFRRKNHDEMR